MAIKVLSVFLLFLIANTLVFVPNSVLAVKSCQGKPDTKVVVTNPPKFVYRVDFREPKEVFKKGMESLKKNDNLLDHMEGRSTKYGSLKDSNFVSTSEQESGALLWAEQQLKANKDKKSIFLYKIGANHNYYSMDEALKYAAANTKDATLKEKYTQVASVAQHYTEWEACGGIEANQIQQATEYKFQFAAGGPPKLQPVGTPTENKNFRMVETHGNQHAYIPKNAA